MDNYIYLKQNENVIIFQKTKHSKLYMLTFGYDKQNKVYSCAEKVGNFLYVSENLIDIDKKVDIYMLSNRTINFYEIRPKRITDFDWYELKEIWLKNGNVYGLYNLLLIYEMDLKLARNTEYLEIINAYVMKSTILSASSDLNYKIYLNDTDYYVSRNNCLTKHIKGRDFIYGNVTDYSYDYKLIWKAMLDDYVTAYNGMVDRNNLEDYFERILGIQCKIHYKSDKKPPAYLDVYRNIVTKIIVNDEVLKLQENRLFVIDYDIVMLEEIKKSQAKHLLLSKQKITSICLYIDENMKLIDFEFSTGRGI